MPDRDRSERAIGVACASLAAALFGLSAPAAKVLVALTDPWLLAGLLYVGAGASLGAVLLGRALLGAKGSREAPLARTDWPWLAAAILAGGGVGPVLLALGLAGTPAAEAALLLNLETVFTALLAWLVFGEHLGRWIAVGLGAMALGAAVLAWAPGQGFRVTSPALLVAGACLAWAVDNNLTRKVAARDPVQIAAWKGGIAGTTNVAIALSRGALFPSAPTVGAAGLVGAVGYGASLVFYIVALRHLGAGRTAGYFATAPFVGAVAGILWLGDSVTPSLGIGASLMAAGVWLHLTERHGHPHGHASLSHAHRHRHDTHHSHGHPVGTPPGEPHNHEHVHTPVTHEHSHSPDLHHWHRH
jgi:drug/metabolite transporter (DMT)-like permease